LLHLRKERFYRGHHEKLKPRADGSFKVLRKIKDNTYKIELPGEYAVFATFNIVDLSPYHEDEDNENSRTSLHGAKAYDVKAFLDNISSMKVLPIA